MTNAAVIRANSQPLAPQPTDAEPRLPVLEDVRAVLFDVYGTLFVSASGDISLTSGASRADAAIEAIEAVGMTARGDRGEAIVEALHAEIKRQHAACACEFPEVDIYAVWQEVLGDSLGIAPINGKQLQRFAIEYETRVNPVWPMPGLVECLDAIRKAGLVMGIVSNAQAFTRDLFPALLGSTADELGFADDLCVWSYEHLHAKPGTYLYELAADALADRGVAPSEALYVGNDMRNDVAPASSVGFRTVLFAGDARSLRLREGDALVVGVEPNAVVTDLRQILNILRLAPQPE